MENIFKTVSFIFFAFLGTISGIAQCGVTYNLSSGNNMYGMVDNKTNPVVVDKDLNTVVFLHRHNTAVYGGNPGNLRYDVSTNGGTTWTTDVGVLNPTSSTHARYPNATLYNPPGNTNPQNAYIGYLAVTTNTSNGLWSVPVSGVRQLSGSGNTEVYNQPNGPTSFKAASVVKGAPGIFWALDQTSQSGNGVYTGTTIVYKGTWSSVNNSINWSVNTTIAPPFNPFAAGPVIGEYNIAFDPTGTYGWIAMTSDISTNSNAFILSPVFYKTVNGGVSWTGPISVDLSQIGCIVSNISPGADPGSISDCDLAVDNNGNPHLLGVFGENIGYDIDYTVWHCAMDITYNGSSWTAYDVSGINAGKGSIVGPISTVSQESSPQVARSVDGKKIFFSWSDNSTYNLGDPNTAPDFFARALDVPTMKWTNVKDFTSCNLNTSGLIFFPHLAREVLEPSAGVYKLAPVYCEFTTQGNPDVVANFRFLDNCLFGSSEFTVSSGTNLSLSVSPGPNALLCPGSPINLQLNGSFSQIFWSNGVQTNNNFVFTPGSYSVYASSGCSSGTAAVTVNSLTYTPITSTTICMGTTLNLSVNGNAYGYTWTPGNLTGTSVALSPIINTTYTLTASGDGCTTTSTMAVGVNPSPIVVAISSRSASCAGEAVTLQASGTNVFVWSNTSVGSSIVVSPTVTTSYTVIGTNAQGCSGSYALTQQVFTCTGVGESETEVAGLVVYPNPNSGAFKLNVKEAADLTVINELGQVVLTLRCDKATLFDQGVNALPAGIYVVNGSVGRELVRQKIVINK